MNAEILSIYLCCPKCKGELKKTHTTLSCPYCHSKYQIEDNIVRIIPDLTKDIELSIGKWDQFYRQKYLKKTYYQEFADYKKKYFDDVFNQLKTAKDIKNLIYLEIGCGQFFLGQLIAKRCKLIIGIDFCPHALKIAKIMLDEQGISNYLLIQADILNLPVKANTLDLIYGGGVIEHFQDTQASVNELYRVLKLGGVSFNTVPYLNLGSLTYRQVWGNIPNFPVLKQLAELIHIRLLKSRHLIFGYEMSFLGSTMKKIHLRAGFKTVKVANFEISPEFNFIPSTFRKPFVWLAKNSPLFWPMIKVVAKK